MWLRIVQSKRVFVCPHCEYREVVCPRALLKDVITNVALITSAALRKIPQQRFGLFPSRRGDVYMCDHIQHAGIVLPCCSGTEGMMHALIIGTVVNRCQLGAKFS